MPSLPKGTDEIMPDSNVIETDATGGDVHEIEQFVQAWCQEFTRAVEMFTGIGATVLCSQIAAIDEAVADPDNWLWWKQSFESTGSFTTWVGSEESTWSTLGNALGTDASGSKISYLEMIGQAQEGAALVASMGLPKPIRCEIGEVSSAPSFTGLAAYRIAINFQEQALASICYLIEPAALSVFRGPAVAVDEDHIQQQTPINAGRSSVMLERLMDLELPLSVALGRAVMPIRDVLRVTPGSMIELDRTVNDYVELLVHGTVVAKGEVVSVKGNYGIRIKEIISKDDRLTLYGGH